jgi:hypothetical protein
MYETVNFATEVIREGYEDHKVVNFDISDTTLLFQLDNDEIWWTGMKIAYKPEKVKLNIKPKLFAAGQRSMAIVDHDNNVLMLKFRSTPKTGFWILSKSRIYKKFRLASLR